MCCLSHCVDCVSHETEPPPVLKAPLNVSSTVGAVAVMACQVEGSMRHNLTWQRAGLTILAHSGRVRVLPNSFLEINEVQPQDAGQYQCVATNAKGDSRVTVWLLVPGTVAHRTPTTLY